MAGSSILRILEASVICCGVTLVLRQTAFHLDWLSKVTVILQFCICVWQHLTSRPPVSHVDRPGADAGILCCILIPMAVLSDYNTFNQISSGSARVMSNSKKDVYFIIILFLFSTYQLKHDDKIKWWLQIILQFSGVIILLYQFNICEYSLVCLLLVLFCYLNQKIPNLLPNCFSFGELATILHLFILTVWRILHSAQTSSILQDVLEVDVFCSVGFISLLIAVLLCYLLNTSCKPGLFYVIYGGVAVVFIIPVLYIYLDQFPIVWLIEVIFKTRTRVLLLCYWVACSLVAGCIVGYISVTADSRDVSTIIRKYFHVVVVAVFIPGLVVDVEFLYLSSVIALAFFIILETIRVCKVPPFGCVIDQSFSMFIDDRDQGVVILTHLYLLIGLSLPLWLTKSLYKATSISLYSGVLSLGIGDTVASIIGSSIGRIHWPGSKKTVEGTTSSIFSQCLTVYILYSLGIIETVYWQKVIMAIILTSLYEAFTFQIDNLVLPVFIFLLLAS